MFELNQSENKIVLKRNNIFLAIGIATIFMAAMGIRLIFGLLPFEEGYTLSDVFGLIFVCVWILIVSGMGVFAFVTNSKKITINDEGIFCNTWFSKRNLEWTEIKDWGLSYCGQTRGEGNTYYLYFSKEQYPIKNECRKKLKGKMIKTFVIGSDYAEIVNEVIPFCASRTKVAPFIGKDKYHFL
ncbi:MAG: hypothetical protein PUB94_00680 [Oscillospiraceae bacterium]|nr:hypothetical protein [Oscillospiraceae bacterium]